MAEATNREQSSTAARGLFVPENRAKVMAMRVGKPTGVTVDAGGIEFDLVPLCTEDGEQVFDLIEKGWGIWTRMRSNDISEEAVLGEIRTKLPDVENFAKLILKRAADIPEDDKEANAIFDEWFKRAPFFKLISDLIPALMKANGFTPPDVPQKPAAEPETPAPTTA